MKKFFSDDIKMQNDLFLSVCKLLYRGDLAMSCTVARKYICLARLDPKNYFQIRSKTPVNITGVFDLTNRFIHVIMVLYNIGQGDKYELFL